MSARRRDWLVLLFLVASSILLAALAPTDQVLGSGLRIVYLHGTWVWAALLAFAAAALTGLLGLILRKDGLIRWSIGLGRSATVFWLISLLLSLAAMQTNWNGLYLAEPRWRVGVRFGVVAVLLQTAGALLRKPRLSGALNILFFGLLAGVLGVTTSVLHPPSPVFASPSMELRLSFLALLACTGAAAIWLGRLMRPNA
jgi:hypothetical protein